MDNIIYIQILSSIFITIFIIILILLFYFKIKREELIFKNKIEKLKIEIENLKIDFQETKTELIKIINQKK